jgi:hypothetical protein
MERDKLVNRITSLFDQIDKSIQDTLKQEFENHGMRGPVQKIFEKDGWSSEQTLKHFFIFLTSQIEQGRKGQGYDQINILINKKSK